MKLIFVCVFLVVININVYANSTLLVREKYNAGIPENIYQKVKYTIPPGKILTVDWSDYELKNRLVARPTVTLILRVNNRTNYTSRLEQAETRIVLSGENMSPDADRKKFKGFRSGDKIDLSIGYYDLETISGNRYFISIWSAKISVK